MNQARCEVLPGDGSVARWGDNVLWASTRTPDLLWDALTAFLRLSSTDPGVPTILDALDAAWSPSEADFALLLVDRHGHGWVFAGGTVHISGTPGDAELTDGVHPVQPGGGPLLVTGAAGSPAGGREHDLRSGSVPGGGFRLLTDGERVSAPLVAVPVPDAGDPADASNTPDAAGHDPSANEDAVAAAVATSVGPDPGATSLHVFDDETGPHQERRHATTLEFDDGTVIPLPRDVVLGRRPDRHDLVTSGAAVPAVIDDPENVLSGAHAAIRHEGGRTVVVDLDSLNGTHVAGPGDREWTRLTPHQPHPLADGHRLLLGWTVLTFRSS